MAVVDNMSVDSLENMAIKYLGVKHPEIQTIAAAYRQDIALRKFKVFA